MRRLNGEDGAVAVMTGIVLVVLLGFGALIIDVGNLYDERRQLQNGADAAALALAAECAEGILDCAAATAVLAGAAQPYADANARDDAAGVPTAMAHGADPAVCDPGGDGAPNPLTDTRTGKVSTETVDADTGARFVTHWLAGLIGTQTTTVTACAVAGWDHAGSLASMPLVISACDYEEGVTVTYPPPHPNPAGVVDRVNLKFHNPGPSADECSAQAGFDANDDGFLPAGFGWLENDGNCNIVTTTVDGQQWVVKETGNNPECSAPDLQAMLGTVIRIPVFNDFCRPAQDPPPDCPPTPNKDKYRIQTYASFYLSGYKLGGGPEYTRGDPCSGSRCIIGYFTKSVVSDGVGGGPEGGVSIIRLTN